MQNQNYLENKEIWTNKNYIIKVDGGGGQNVSKKDELSLRMIKQTRLMAQKRHASISPIYKLPWYICLTSFQK